MKMAHSNLLLFVLILSVIKVTKGDDGHHPSNSNKNKSTQVLLWKTVNGGLIDGIRQKISSIFHADISPEARIPSVGYVSYQLSLL